MTLIGSEGSSAPVSLGGGFSESEERTIEDLAFADVGDLYAVELVNESPADGLRVGTLEFVYKGVPFVFGKNVMVRSIQVFNGSILLSLLTPFDSLSSSSFFYLQLPSILP